MNMNIVRRIELIKTWNRKKKEKDEYDFIALGDFDYVNQKNISKTKMTISSLWKDMSNAYETDKLCNVNRQIYYLVCSPEYKDADNDLWKTNTSEFYIITMMHVTNIINDELIKSVNGELSGIGVCYVTPNNCDLICVLKISDYKKGLCELKKLNKNVSFTYTFSIPFFPIGFKNKGCIIKKAIIHINFKSSTGNVIKRLKEKFEVGALLQKLGHDDYAIELIDVNLSYIVSYLHDGGIFAYDAETKDECVLSTRTYLYVNDEIVINKSQKQCLSNDKVMSMIKKINELFGSNNEVDRIIKYTFNQLFTTLEEFREASTYNIAYYTIVDFLDMFLNKYILLKNQCLIDFEEKEDCLYILDTCLKLIRNTLNDDIHSNSLPLYDNDIYNVPGKLLYFFISYGYEAIKYLNDDENTKYKMLLNPTLEGTLSLTKLLTNEEDPADRLTIVNFPISNFYDIKKSQFNLLHECSHYVGSEPRKRAERIKHIIKAIAKIIAIRLVKDFKKEFAEYKCKVEFNSDIINLSDYLISYELDNLTKTIYAALKVKTDEFIANNEKKDKSYNSVAIQRIVGYATFHVIDELELGQILDNIQEVITNYELSKKVECSLNDIYDKVTNVHSEFVKICNGLRDGSNNTLSIINNLNNIILETRETYADLTACKVLDIQFIDYLEHLVKDIENTDSLMLNEMLNRVALISLLYDVKDKNNDEKEADNALLKKLKDVNLQENFIQSLLNIRKEIRDDYFMRTNEKNHIALEEKSSLDQVFQWSYVSAEVEIYKYLLECNENIMKNDFLSILYNGIENDNNIYETVLKIHKCLYLWENLNIPYPKEDDKDGS